MTPTAGTIAVLSLCGFFGNVGAALTGFGEAIVFLFFWQVIDLAAGGMYGNFKHAIFIQALSLFSVQVGVSRGCYFVFQWPYTNSSNNNFFSTAIPHVGNFST